jgi:hypothetical protein
MDVRYDIEIPIKVTAPFRREVMERRQEALVELLFYDSLIDPQDSLGK